MDDTLRAGAARVDLPVSRGTAMMGYGARRGSARGSHDPLSARALFLAAGGGRALLVECDLCLLGVEQCDALRQRIAEATSLAVGEIAVGCIHTHSGPETGLAALVSGEAAPPEVAGLLDAIKESAVLAVRGAVPARIGVDVSAASIGRNRRAEVAPIDERLLVLRVDHGDGEPLAVLFVHGCHPTVLGHDNLWLSADWPGAARAHIEAALPGAIALFALGAHGDVDPRTRALQDLVLPDQSRGAGFDAVESLGREVGEAVMKSVAAITTRGDARVRARSTRLRLAVHGGRGAERREHLERLRMSALAALDLPADSALRVADFYHLEHERTEGLAAEVRRERIARVRLYLREKQALRIAGGEQREVEVQLLELGGLELLALPLEVTVDVGAEWRSEAGDHAAVISIANGWLRYLPHSSHFEGPTAHQQYEVLNSVFVPESAAQLLEAGSRLREGEAATTS